MKTEISRDSFRPDARYSGVYLQQGRMITDADWNEQADIVRARLAAALNDLIGRGAPVGQGVIDGSTGSPELRWGRVYADGVGADVIPASEELLSQPFDYNSQKDYPDTRALPSQCVLYGDIWERPVVFFEDDDLRDPALNGADTSSRTRTMAQIKWCDAPAVGADPECLDKAVNPPSGDAELTVSLRESGTTGDECDPCASEITVPAQVRSYLFRLEVHDVAGLASNPTSVRLKWSAENGAELRSMSDSAAVEAEVAFATSTYAYEFFDETTDLYLGVDLSGLTPTRGEMRSGYPSGASSLGKDFVRRWDGYCTLLNDGSGNWTLESDGDSSAAVDSGVALSTSSAAEASGHVDLSGGSFKVNLESLVLELALTGHSFVAGDYWLAVIRESADTDQRVSQFSTVPTGIIHHYVELVKKDGTYEWLSDEHRRRTTFPAITDLDANHVSYSPSACANSLFNAADHDTVQRALDALCALNATHVAFTPEPCDNNLFDSSHDTVQKALKALCALHASHVAFSNCDPDQATSPFYGLTTLTVQAALERLCNLAATSVTFANCDPDQATSPFYGLTTLTVQAALERLCNLAAASVTFANCDPDPATSPFHGLTTLTVQAALERLCNLSASNVTYTPPSDCTTLVGTSTVEEALNAICNMESGDNCGARLRLFGRGIVCGVIPDVTVSYTSGTRVPFTVQTTAGTVIDGWGCVRDIDGLTFSDSLQGYRLTSGTSGSGSGTGLFSSGPTLSGSVSTTFLTEATKATPTLTPISSAAKRWLYLVLPKNGDPYLELRTSFDGHLVTAAADTAYDSSDCDKVKSTAWAPYQQVGCVADPVDGTAETRLCVGTLGLRGNSAWVCPDDREAITTAPIKTQALETRDRDTTFGDFETACQPTT